MPFDHKPLEKISGPKPIELAKHQINHWPLINWVDNWLAYYFLERPLRINQDLDITELAFKSPIETQWPENNVVKVRHYKASDEFAVLVLPPRSAVGGRSTGYKIEQVIASYLATNGISAYEIDTPLHGTRRPKGKTIDELMSNISGFKLFFNQAVTEIRGLLDFVEEEKAGILGVSLGGLYASIAYGLEDRLLSACLVMAAGGLADMVFESEDTVAKHLKTYADRNRMTREQLQVELKDVEPCSYANPQKGRNMLLINGLKDRKLPLKYAKSLAMAWDSEPILLRGGHGSAILKIPYILPRILEHYEKTLKNTSFSV